MNVKVIRLFTGPDGETHFEDGELELQKGDFAPPAEPIGVTAFQAASAFGFLGGAPGWFGDWHPAPRRQFIIWLSGQTEIAVSDGEVRILKPGDVLLLEDTTGKGHASRTVGHETAFCAVVQLPE